MIAVIVLAAGKGTRMNDMNIPKVLRQVGGKSMLEHVVLTAKKLSENIIVVVSDENKQDIENLSLQVEYCIQKTLNGTASAVLSAEEKYQNKDILVLLGDVPLLKYETLSEIVNENNKCVILGFQNEDVSNKFGRIILNDNKVEKIVEYNEATSIEKNIKNVNSGILYLHRNYTHFLKEIDNNNSKSEYYLTDIVKILNHNNIQVSYKQASAEECLGANTPQDLQVLNQIFEGK